MTIAGELTLELRKIYGKLLPTAEIEIIRIEDSFLGTKITLVLRWPDNSAASIEVRAGSMSEADVRLRELLGSRP